MDMSIPPSDFTLAYQPIELYRPPSNLWATLQAAVACVTSAKDRIKTTRSAERDLHATPAQAMRGPGSATANRAPAAFVRPAVMLPKRVSATKVGL
jgi:hypothetical protein